MTADFRHLSLRQLRLVAKLGTALHLSQAAHDLHMTQPAASRSLAQLEGMLGQQLFDRSGRRLTPTAAGMRFIHHAQKVLDQLGAAEQEMAGSNVTDELRVGAIPSISSALLAGAVQSTGEQLPALRVKVFTGRVADLYGQLLGGSIDVMVSHAELSVDLNRVVVSPVYHEQASIVAGVSHRFAKRRKLGWAEIAGQPWILPPPFTPFRPKIDRILAVYRLHAAAMSPDVEVESHSVAVNLLRNGIHLWSLASREAAFWEAAGLLRQLVQPDAVLQGHMCCLQLRGTESKTAPAAFVSALRSQAAEPTA